MKRITEYTDSRLGFRQFRPDDLSSALVIFDSNVPDFFTLDERRVFEVFLHDLPGPYFVIEEEPGQVVACGGYAIVAEELRADLCWGMVDRAHHGRGIGRFLTQLRISAARNDPRVSHLVLNTSQHTREFYEKLGFVAERVTVDGYSPGLDRCDMRLQLR